MTLSIDERVTRLEKAITNLGASTVSGAKGAVSISPNEIVAGNGATKLTQYGLEVYPGATSALTPGTWFWDPTITYASALRNYPIATVPRFELWARQAHLGLQIDTGFDLLAYINTVLYWALDDGTASAYAPQRLVVGGTATDSIGMLEVRPQAATDVGLRIKGATSQSGKYVDFVTSASAVVFGVRADGSVDIVDGNQAAGRVFTSDANGKGNWAAAAGGPGLANPSAQVGLTVVNGSAITAMRSDGAPALSVAIIPTWTGRHTFSNATYSALFTGGPVGIGTATPSAYAGLTLGGGVLCIKDATTPTANAGYGKIYGKSNNYLYYQDSLGVERPLAYYAMLQVALIMSASDTSIKSADTLRSSTSATYVKVKEFQLGVQGTYRISFNLRSGDANYAACGRIYRNGAAVGTERTCTTLTAFSEDLAGWNPGDLCQLYIRIQAAGEGPASGDSFRLYGTLAANATVITD